MKKIFLIAIFMLLPVHVHAALLAPGTQPLQPIPGGIAPNVNANINTPGNDYNKAAEGLNEQSNPQAEQINRDEPQNIIGSQASKQADASVYVILIVVASVGLLAALGFLYYRYRIKSE